MNWDQLLSGDRLGGFGTDSPNVRTRFQRDFDRIVFSTAFRRMNGKTQVFPLPRSDITHTRLTHSLEAASVARSLGTIVSNQMGIEGANDNDLSEILAAATLAHDIGNPPFGHSGEDAIQQYFLTAGSHFLSVLNAAECRDLQCFEGNALGFRLLTHTRPRQSRWGGGLQLTMATLGAFMKYPRGSLPVGTGALASEKKFGFFQAEAETFETVATRLGLKQKGNETWHRHPLAFLLEAADDISYRIIDVEDGYRQNLVPFDATFQLFRAIANAAPSPTSEQTLAGLLSRDEQIGYLRAKAINNLVHQAAAEFVEHHDDILAGEYDQPLLAQVPSNQDIDAIKRTCEELIFVHRPVVEIEAAGFEVIGGLLADLVPLLWEHPRSKRAAKVLGLVPPEYLPDGAVGSDNAYDTLLNITDFVAGMTDEFAISNYRVLKGIELPFS